MSVPSHEELLNSSARWDGEHNGIRYELNWHGRSDYRPNGTWCYYIIVTSEQFYPDDWAKLRLERADHDFNGSWHRQWSYENFPDVDWHGGCTFGEMETYLARDGKEHEHVKVGCDYAHHFDEVSGYWEGKVNVEQDAKRSIDELIRKFPRRRQRCWYSGKYDDPENFYEAKNGALIHNSWREKMLADKYDGWKPKNEVAA